MQYDTNSRQVLVQDECLLRGIAAFTRATLPLSALLATAQSSISMVARSGIAIITPKSSNMTAAC